LFKTRQTPALFGPQALVAMGAIVVLLGNLCVLAAHIGRGGELTSMLVVVDALAAAAIILFRQLRKTTQSLIASEARAQYISLHDSLTALPNRLQFLSRLTEALDHSRREGGLVAVVTVAIDDFSKIVDAYGYHCADEMIIEAARRLSSVSQTSALLARVNSDTFALIHTAAETLDMVIHQIREVVPRPYALPAGRAVVTCSLGVSAAFREQIDADDLLRKADIALRNGRETGHEGLAFYEPAMDQALQTRKLVEADLRAALIAGQLAVVYQPQTTPQGNIGGLEALVRWRHPRRGDVPPDYFVGLAEEAGLMPTLGRFVFQRAFRDAARWPNLKIAVNVSATQIVRADFLADVTNLLAEAGANAGQFEIEITEHVLLGEDSQTQANLRGLRNLGFSLALDDFGVGYSSLSYLLQHRVDKIKIDRSFVTPLGGSPSADAVVGAMIKLGDALSLRVLAEGVETEAQRKRLSELGCNELQGYLISKPITADEVDRLITPAGRGAIAA
jgi:diguanylate cyclase (GGDEF)-like protein